MPFYDFKCKCGATVELLVPPSAIWRKHSECGMRMQRLFPTEFAALNTTSANGEKFKGLEVGLGVRPQSCGELTAIMKEQGCRPADEYRYTKGEVRRQEITEKELGQVLADHNSLGTL